jgi:hypothetical protein
VFSVLQISRLVKDGKLLFLPHPRLSKLGWFVVLSPHEALLLLQPSVDSFHRVIRAMGKDSSGLNADEKSHIKTIERYSKEAFEQATSVSSDEARWHIASGELRQAIAHAILPDELGSGTVGRQLVIYLRKIAWRLRTCPIKRFFIRGQLSSGQLLRSASIGVTREKSKH